MRVVLGGKKSFLMLAIGGVVAIIGQFYSGYGYLGRILCVIDLMERKFGKDANEGKKD